MHRKVHKVTFDCIHLWRFTAYFRGHPVCTAGAMGPSRGLPRIHDSLLAGYITHLLCTWELTGDRQ